MSALPSAINYQEGLAVLPENTQNFNVACVPVSGGAIGPSSQIQVDLGNRGFLDPASLLIRYKIVYSIANAITGYQRSFQCSEVTAHCSAVRPLCLHCQVTAELQ